MSIANEKIVNLQDAKVLYDDLRGRIKDNSVVEVLDTPADIQSFSDAARFPMELKVGIDPVQDLHGYDYPWIGGAGKNKLPLTVENIKAANTNGTWSGNAYTEYGITYTILFDSDGNVTGININGTNTHGAIVTFGIAVYDFGSSDFRSDGSATSSTYKIFSGRNDDSANLQRIQYQGSNQNTYIRIATGASFSNVVVTPMICLASETDTTFAPYTNIAPITGWAGAKVSVTGKNLIRKLVASSSAGLTVSINGDNSVAVTGTPTSNDIFATRNYNNDDLLYLKAGTYRIVLTTSVSVSGCAIRIGESNGTFITQGTNNTFTINKSRYIKVAFRIQNNSGTALNFTAYPMLLRADETDFTYEEPTSTVYPISFPTSSGTVYGGELTIHSDGSGELVVDRASIDISTLNWVYDTSNVGHERFSANDLVNVAKRPEDAYSIANIVCSIYQPASNIETFNHTKDHAIAIGQTGYAYIYHSTYTTVSALKNAIAGQTLVYELASPVTYQLTPGQVFALLGQNNIWADCGQVNYLEYVRDAVGEVIPNRFDGIEQDIVDTNTYEKSITESSVVQSFDDGASWPMGMQIAVDPVQDLHGYSSPWLGGSSKNLLPMNATLPVSSNGIRYNLKYDGTIDARGTATADAYVYVDFTSETLGTSGDLYFIGAPNGGASTYHAYVWDKTNNQRAKQWDGTTNCENAYGNGFKKVKILENVQYTFVCRVMNGVSVTNVVFTPMICLGTETDTTFVPYENICPITGWNETTVNVNGTNLFDPNVTGDAYPYPYTIRGITVSNDNGVITINGTVESPEFFYPQNYGLYKNVILPSTTYVFTAGHVDSQMEIRVYYTERLNSDTNSNWKILKTAVGKEELEFTTPSKFNNIWIRINYAAGVVLNNVKLYPMIRLATDVDTTFESYAGKTYTVSFPSDAGTVYGGNLTVNKDGTGELSVNWKKKTIDGSYDWTATGSGNFQYFYNNSLEEYGAIVNNTVFSDTYSLAGISATNEFVGINLWNRSASSQVRLAVRPINTSSYTAATFKTYLEGHPFDICYGLSSPTVYSLTPGQVLSLIGKNHVWADTGDILSLTYNSKQGMEFIREDTAGQINTVVNPVKTELADAEAAMAIVVDGDTAPKNITSGQYVFVKNHSTLATGLYHATAAISSGASITSSNVEADADGGFNAMMPKQLTVTRVENDYCDATAVNRITAYKTGKLLVIRGNLRIAANDTQVANILNIATISGWHGATDLIICVPAQTDGSKVAVIQISNGGYIYFSSSTTLPTTFYRFSGCIPSTD